MVQSALLRGKISLVHPTSGALEVLKSAIAIPVYLITLPFLLLLGQHIFMKYLVKTFDHAGRLLHLWAWIRSKTSTSPNSGLDWNERQGKSGGNVDTTTRLSNRMI